jgi:hypothetical protein
VKELRERLQLSQMTLIHFSPERALQPPSARSSKLPHGRDLERAGRFPRRPGAAVRGRFCDTSSPPVMPNTCRTTTRLWRDQPGAPAGGVAILPVPIVEERTIEYQLPIRRGRHVDAGPGLLRALPPSFRRWNLGSSGFGGFRSSISRPYRLRGISRCQATTGIATRLRAVCIA